MLWSDKPEGGRESSFVILIFAFLSVLCALSGQTLLLFCGQVRLNFLETSEEPIGRSAFPGHLPG
jgi:hypothetical protein